MEVACEKKTCSSADWKIVVDLPSDACHILFGKWCSNSGNCRPGRAPAKENLRIFLIQSAAALCDRLLLFLWFSFSAHATTPPQPSADCFLHPPFPVIDRRRRRQKSLPSTPQVQKKVSNTSRLTPLSCCSREKVLNKISAQGKSQLG